MYYANKYREGNQDEKPPVKPKKEKKGLKSKTKPLTLVEELDRVFSEYVRKSAADASGFVKCYTCPTVKHWKKMQNGHFIKRSNMATRWYVPNNHVQCDLCNENLSGNLVVYSENLQKQYGNDILLELSFLAASTKKFSKPELQQMIDEYKQLNKQLGS